MPTDDHKDFRPVTDAAPTFTREDAGTLPNEGSADPVYARAQKPKQRPDDEHPTVQPPPLQDDGPVEQDQADGKKRRKGLLRQYPFLSLMGLLFFILVAAGAYLYWDDARHFETTDDAFIAARQFSIASKVSGYITTVPVTDNQHLQAGDVVARIDDRDYRVVLEQADAQVAAAEANIRNVDAQTKTQQAQVAASQAQVDQAQAGLVFAQQQADRYQHLSETGTGSVQNAEQYTSQLHQQEAALASANAALTVAQRQFDALAAQRKSAEASLAQAKAQHEQAQLNLDYTTVRAAQPGRVVNLGAAAGQFAQAGTGLAMFVPDDIWVTANYKETQLDQMRPGQPATIEIDAYPDRTMRGHVDSVQPGSGTAFSLLPAQNATGNFVKIVQRVPVKIVMEDPPTDVALGPGMSVVPTVRIEPGPSLLERLRATL